MFDTVPLNYLMSERDAGLLDLIITHDMLPSSFPNILNTSNPETIAPGCSRNGSTRLQIEVNVTQAPSLTRSHPT